MRVTRIIAPIAAATAMSSALVIGATAVPPAFADSTPLAGCSSPYTLDTITNIDAFSRGLIPTYFPNDAALMALLNSLDHNGDGWLCWKIPPGWNGPPATNGAHRAGFVNLVDNKMAGN